MKKIVLATMLSIVFIASHADNSIVIPGFTIPTSVGLEPRMSKEFGMRSSGLIAVAAGLSLINTGLKRATESVQVTDATTNNVHFIYPNAKSGSLLAALGAALAAGGIWAITR